MSSITTAQWHAFRTSESQVINTWKIWEWTPEGDTNMQWQTACFQGTIGNNFANSSRQLTTYWAIAIDRSLPASSTFLFLLHHRLRSRFSLYRIIFTLKHPRFQSAHEHKDCYADGKQVLSFMNITLICNTMIPAFVPDTVPVNAIICVVSTITVATILV